jgi:hypothetical protein
LLSENKWKECGGCWFGIMKKFVSCVWSQTWVESGVTYSKFVSNSGSSCWGFPSVGYP